MSVITARFASTCPCCSLPIAVGAKVEWSKGSKAAHVACAPVAATISAAPAGVDPTYGRRPRGGCGNPRDCGDPTCHGECGY